MDDIYHIGERHVNTIVTQILPNMRDYGHKFHVIKRTMSSEAYNGGFTLENIDLIQSVFYQDDWINYLDKDYNNLILSASIYEVLQGAVSDLKEEYGDNSDLYNIINYEYLNSSKLSKEAIREKVCIPNKKTYATRRVEAHYIFAAFVYFRFRAIETDLKHKASTQKNSTLIFKPKDVDSLRPIKIPSSEPSYNN